MAADLDGDGDVDALAGHSDGTIAWYENTDGAGSFGPEQVISSIATGSAAIFAADLDGDLDVFLSSPGDDTIAWYENTDGSGSFGPARVITTTAAGVRGLSVADFDGDGDPDVLAAISSANTVAWYENLLGTDPLDPDTDDDGLLDGFEVSYGFDPFAADEEPNGTLDGQDDADADGLNNADEQFYGTHPGVPDTDGDGFGDGLEILEGTDPLDEFDFPVQAVPSADLWAMTLLITALLTVRVCRFARPNDV